MPEISHPVVGIAGKISYCALLIVLWVKNFRFGERFFFREYKEDKCDPQLNRRAGQGFCP